MPCYNLLSVLHLHTASLGTHQAPGEVLKHRSRRTCWHFTELKLLEHLCTQGQFSATKLTHEAWARRPEEISAGNSYTQTSMRPARLSKLWLNTGQPDPIWLSRETHKFTHTVLWAPEGSLHSGTPQGCTAGCAQQQSAPTVPSCLFLTAMLYTEVWTWAGVKSSFFHWISTVEEKPLHLKRVWPKKATWFRFLVGKHYVGFNLF